MARLAADAGRGQTRGFSTAEPSLLVAITESGEQISLLIVPPDAKASSARVGLAKSADPANRLQAPAILAALSIEPLTSLGAGAAAGTAGRPVAQLAKA